VDRSSFNELADMYRVDLLKVMLSRQEECNSKCFQIDMYREENQSFQNVNRTLIECSTLKKREQVKEDLE